MKGIKYKIRNKYRLWGNWLVAKILNTGLIKTKDQGDLKADCGVKYIKYENKEIHKFDASFGYKSEPIERAIEKRKSWLGNKVRVEELENKKYSVKCREVFVAELKNVKLFGPHAVAKTSDGQIPLENKAEIRGERGSFEGMLRSNVRQFGVLDTAKVLLESSEQERKFDVAASILTGRTHSTPAYGHWLLEILPRIRGIKKYRQRTGRHPTILVNSNIKEWQMRSLKLAGVNETNITRWNKGTALVKRYVLPKWSKAEWCESDIEWVRKKMKSAINYKKHMGKFSKRVFISRENMSRRRILNRKEIMNVLSTHGFRKYCPESLTIAEQVALFESADILVGPTGGGFTNMIFSKEVDIIEIFQPNHFITWFFELASVLGHEYLPLFGDSVDKYPNLSPHHYDFTVSASHINDVLEDEFV